MKIIGLTGMIAAGKSTLCSQFQSLLPNKKFYIFDCDRECHSIIPNENDRQRIADSIFSSDENRRQFEKSMWDGLRPILAESIKNKEKVVDFFILDAPTLFQSGYDSMCHYIIFVTADKKIRKERFLNRGTRDVGDFERRDKIQADFFDENKNLKIDLLLDTSTEGYFSKLQDFFSRL